MVMMKYIFTHTPRTGYDAKEEDVLFYWGIDRLSAAPSQRGKSLLIITHLIFSTKKKKQKKRRERN